MAPEHLSSDWQSEMFQPYKEEAHLPWLNFLEACSVEVLKYIVNHVTVCGSKSHSKIAAFSWVSCSLIDMLSCVHLTRLTNRTDFVSNLTCVFMNTHIKKCIGVLQMKQVVLILSYKHRAQIEFLQLYPWLIPRVVNAHGCHSSHLVTDASVFIAL